MTVQLVGARDRTPESIAVSNANMQKVTEIIKNYDVDVESADIGNKEIPSAIVVDPVTGIIEHAVPGKEDKSTPTVHDTRVNPC